MTWRTPEERYGLYVVRRDLRRWSNLSKPRQIATAPDLVGIGAAFAANLEDGTIRVEDRVGVLDSHGRDDVRGTWILNPYGRGGED